VRREERSLRFGRDDNVGEERTQKRRRGPSATVGMTTLGERRRQKRRRGPPTKDVGAGLLSATVGMTTLKFGAQSRTVASAVILCVRQTFLDLTLWRNESSSRTITSCG
jgi:hypothetical protein